LQAHRQVEQELGADLRGLDARHAQQGVEQLAAGLGGE
jgi:hypothetical protein